MAENSANGGGVADQNVNEKCKLGTRQNHRKLQLRRALVYIGHRLGEGKKKKTVPAQKTIITNVVPCRKGPEE